MRIAPGIRLPELLGLGRCLVDFRYAPAEGVAIGNTRFGGLNAFDAAPALAGLGQYLAHLADRVIDTALVTESGFSHHGS